MKKLLITIDESEVAFLWHTACQANGIPLGLENFEFPQGDADKVHNKKTAALFWCGGSECFLNAKILRDYYVSKGHAACLLWDLSDEDSGYHGWAVWVDDYNLSKPTHPIKRTHTNRKART